MSNQIGRFSCVPSGMNISNCTIFTAPSTISPQANTEQAIPSPLTASNAATDSRSRKRVLQEASTELMTASPAAIGYRKIKEPRSKLRSMRNLPTDAPVATTLQRYATNMLAECHRDEAEYRFGTHVTTQSSQVEALMATGERNSTVEPCQKKARQSSDDADMKMTKKMKIQDNRSEDDAMEVDVEPTLEPTRLALQPRLLDLVFLDIKKRERRNCVTEEPKPVFNLDEMLDALLW